MLESILLLRVVSVMCVNRLFERLLRMGLLGVVSMAQLVVVLCAV